MYRTKFQRKSNLLFHKGFYSFTSGMKTRKGISEAAPLKQKKRGWVGGRRGEWKERNYEDRWAGKSTIPSSSDIVNKYQTQIKSALTTFSDITLFKKIKLILKNKQIFWKLKIWKKNLKSRPSKFAIFFLSKSTDILKAQCSAPKSTHFCSEISRSTIRNHSTTKKQKQKQKKGKALLLLLTYKEDDSEYIYYAYVYVIN